MESGLNNKVRKAFLLLAIFAGVTLSAASGPDNVIPAPVSYTLGKGTVPSGGLVPKVIPCGKSFSRLAATLPSFARDEAYRLVISPKGATVEAMTEAGVFYALQTLSQMRQADPEVLCCEIIDYPRFPYRGLHIDVSRHFRTKEFIAKQMRLMSELKMNRLHLHLTDSEGWRLQIDAFPELTTRAAWRPEILWPQWRKGGKKLSEEGAPGAYGGYYTRKDIEWILSVADSCHITVIPEIEMPGHSSEVTTVYPELLCRTEDGTEPEYRNDLCPGNEATYVFLEKVLDEVCSLFPSEFIHIGGDEAGKRAWMLCPLCRHRMEEEGLADVDQLQSYLVRRVEKMLEARGKRLLGWDEILQGGLAPNATVMSWRGTAGGIQAVSEGHDAIMTPEKYCYLDRYQDAPFKEPESFGSYVPVDTVYSFDPCYMIPETLQHHLLGVQGNSWSEYIVTDEHLEYMLYPRAYALAEVGWTPMSRKDPARFRANALRLNEQVSARGYHPFDLAHERGVRKVDFPESFLSKGRPVRYGSPYHKSYAAGGDGALTDAVCGGWNFRGENWQGFLCDIDVTVDLGSVQPVHYAGATFLTQWVADIFLPDKIEILLSEDGDHFSLAGTVSRDIAQPSGGTQYIPFGIVLEGNARFVRLKAYREKGFLFIDEFVVN